MKKPTIVLAHLSSPKRPRPLGRTTLELSPEKDGLTKVRLRSGLWFETIEDHVAIGGLITGVEEMSEDVTGWVGSRPEVETFVAEPGQGKFGMVKVCGDERLECGIGVLEGGKEDIKGELELETEILAAGKTWQDEEMLGKGTGWGESRPEV